MTSVFLLNWAIADPSAASISSEATTMSAIVERNGKANTATRSCSEETITPLCGDFPCDTPLVEDSNTYMRGAEPPLNVDIILHPK